MEGLRIQLLGGFRVQVGPRVIPESAWRPKTARLVTLLALTPGHRLHREQLLELLWPEFEPQAAANNLHRTLHAARHSLEPELPPGTPSAYLHLHAEGLALFASVGALWIDVEAFEVAASVARHAREPAAYRAALELYTSDLLPEDRYEDWATGRREELRELYLALLLELTHVHEERGELPAAIQALERVVVTEPTHEPAQVALMRLQARSGRRQQALRQYDHLQDALALEVGAEPATTSQSLYRDILAGRFPPAATTPTAAQNEQEQSAYPPGAGRRSHNLPTPLTTFVGREQEIAEVRHLLGTTRLLTLTGAGGVGKTRLALQVATDPLDACVDGVWMVDLAAVAEPRLVPPARHQGDYARAAALFEESLAMRRALGVKWGIALSLGSLADLAQQQRDWPRAAALSAESLALLRELGDTRGIATELEDLAGILGAHGQPVWAVQLLGAASMLRETIGAPLPPALHAGYQRTVAIARAGLDEAAFATAWAVGRALTLEQAVTTALTVALSNTSEGTSQRQPVSLSHREQEVTALVAQGDTNRRIAAELGLAERTVDAHVSHILAKLGLTSRAQIRAWAEEHRLRPEHPN